MTKTPTLTIQEIADWKERGIPPKKLYITKTHDGTSLGSGLKEKINDIAKQIAEDYGKAEDGTYHGKTVILNRNGTVELDSEYLGEFQGPSMLLRNIKNDKKRDCVLVQSNPIIPQETRDSGGDEEMSYLKGPTDPEGYFINGNRPPNQLDFAPLSQQNEEGYYVRHVVQVNPDGSYWIISRKDGYNTNNTQNLFKDQGPVGDGTSYKKPSVLSEHDKLKNDLLDDYRGKRDGYVEEGYSFDEAKSKAVEDTGTYQKVVLEDGRMRQKLDDNNIRIRFVPNDK